MLQKQVQSFQRQLDETEQIKQLYEKEKLSTADKSNLIENLQKKQKELNDKIESQKQQIDNFQEKNIAIQKEKEMLEIFKTQLSEELQKAKQILSEKVKLFFYRYIFFFAYVVTFIFNKRISIKLTDFLSVFLNIIMKLGYIHPTTSKRIAKNERKLSKHGIRTKQGKNKNRRISKTINSIATNNRKTEPRK
jgi:hypothetical protein